MHLDDPAAIPEVFLASEEEEGIALELQPDDLGRRLLSPLVDRVLDEARARGTALLLWVLGTLMLLGGWRRGPLAVPSLVPVAGVELLGLAALAYAVAFHNGGVRRALASWRGWLPLGALSAVAGIVALAEGGDDPWGVGAPLAASAVVIGLGMVAVRGLRSPLRRALRVQEGRLTLRLGPSRLEVGARTWYWADLAQVSIWREDDRSTLVVVPRRGRDLEQPLAKAYREADLAWLEACLRQRLAEAGAPDGVPEGLARVAGQAAQR